MKSQFNIVLLIGFVIVVVVTTPLIAMVCGREGLIVIGATLAALLYIMIMVELVLFSIRKGVYRE